MMEARDRQFNLPGLFGLRRCRSCGLVALSPRPTPAALVRFYPSDYYSFHPQDLSAVVQPGRPAGVSPARRAMLRLRWEGRRLCLAALGYESVGGVRHAIGTALLPVLGRRAGYGYEQFPRWREGGRALDVGCGSGQFLALLKKHGWKTAGVDVSAAAAAAADRAYGISVKVGEITACRPEDGRFDFINMSHVIEHMYDPLGGLRSAKELLSGDGEIYIETPNAAARNARAMGPYWYPWDAPRHLYLFDPATLRLVARNAGLVVRRLETREMGQVYGQERTYRLADGLAGGSRAAFGSARVSRGLRSRRPLGRRAPSRQDGDIISAWLSLPSHSSGTAGHCGDGGYRRLPDADRSPG